MLLSLAALHNELFATMQGTNDQMILQIGNMGNEYEEQAIEELYFRLIVKQTGTQIDKIIRAVRYANGIRVIIENADRCKALFFTTVHSGEEEEEEEEDKEGDEMW